MSSPRIRALVLAAGFGTRLRPLTGSLPKPLLPVAGRPLIARSLDALVDIGCEAAAINLHHLGDQIRDHLGSSYQEMPLHYSEETEILGTLGALGPLKDFFRPADLVIVINGDSLCRWPVAKVLKAHQASEAVATLLVSDKANPVRFGGGIGVGEGGRIEFFRKISPASPARAEEENRPKEPENLDGSEPSEGPERKVFAGLHIFSPTLLDRIDSGPADFVTALYEPLLEEGALLLAVATSRDWHDLGTPRRYLEGVLDWTKGRRPKRLIQRRSWVAEDADLDETVTVETSAIEAGTKIAAGAVIERSLVLPGAEIGESCEIRETIVGFDASLPAGTFVQRRMINSQKAGFTAGPGDSLLGDLVYTPLERA